MSNSKAKKTHTLCPKKDVEKSPLYTSHRLKMLCLTMQQCSTVEKGKHHVMWGDLSTKGEYTLPLRRNKNTMCERIRLLMMTHGQKEK
jgi:hypothetical protein